MSASNAAQAVVESLPEDPQALAELAGQAMYERDTASQGLGARLDSVAPGKAGMSMAVQPHMLNGHKTCHGGSVCAVAASACASACNSRHRGTDAPGRTR